MRKRFSPLLVALCALLASPLLAEPVGPHTVPVPGRSIAGNDDASAVGQNPANLGFLPGIEAKWTWVRTGQGSPESSRGHSFDLAFPLPFHVGTGLRLDVVRPPESANLFFRDPYTWLTWGLSVRASRALSFGGSIAHSYSDSSIVDGLTSLNLAVSARTNPYVGLSIVGRDLNTPRSVGYYQQKRSVDVALAIRPNGRSDFELGLEARYFQSTGDLEPRGTLSFVIPYVGRARGEVALSDPTLGTPLSYRAMAGLEVGWGNVGLEGGAVFGNAIGKDGAGVYTGIALSQFRHPGIPEPAYAVKLRMESTPGARNHVHLLQKLWRLARDPEVRAVAFLLKTEPVDSLAHGEELGDAIRLLQANGKKVICHLEDAKGRALFACSQADRIVINPAGGIRFAGLRMQYSYYGRLLENLGIRAEFVRIGAHKSAPESFMREGATETAREDHLDLLRENQEVFVSDIGGGRRISAADLERTFAAGPFVASEAKEHGLVDGFAFDDELSHVVDEVVGTHVRLLDEPPSEPPPRRFGQQRGIALVYLDGDMVDGKSRDVPILGGHLAGSYTVAEALKHAREDKSIEAVVLRVESPGGSSMAADVIWREAALTAKAKPLIVSMGSYAASGGYYVAAAGSKIFANRLTVTGSIGIFYGKADISALMRKVGLNVETYKTAPRADAESIYRPFTPEEVRELQHKITQFYGTFLDRVATGRKMSKEQVDAVGQGRVWTGRQAQQKGLVDSIGGLREALAEARRLAHLPEDARIEELPVPEKSLLNTALELAGLDEPTHDPLGSLLPASMIPALRALTPFLVFDPDQPLSRMELVPLDAP